MGLQVAQYIAPPVPGDQPQAEYAQLQLDYLNRRRDTERYHRDAEEHLRQALAVDPNLLEARLRLGRVLTLRGRFDEAARELGIVAKQTRAGAENYLANLFLGAVCQRQPRIEEAMIPYRQAHATRPRAQAARMALAYGHASRGEKETARRMVLDALAEPWPAPRELDPWRDYARGRWQEGEERLEKLRQRVSR